MIALLLALLQGELDVPTPKGWTRKVDPATRLVTLAAPEADTQLLVYPLSTSPLGDAKDAQKLMLTALLQGGSLSGATSGKTGRFLWTRASFAPAAGDPARLVLYTAKSGDSLATLVFFAPEKAFEERLPAVEELVRGLRFGEGIAIHGLVFAALDGWTRGEDPSGSVTLSPPPPGPLQPTWDYVMHVLATRPLDGPHWAAHRALHEEVAKALKDPVPARWEPNGPGPFIKSTTAGRDASGAIRPLTLYSARSANGLEAIIVANQEDVETIGALLHRVTLKAPPPAAKTKVVEAWRRLDASIRIDPRPLQYERIWLREDGVADFSTSYPEGYGASSVPAKLDPTLLNGEIGAWTKAGDGLVLTTRAGATRVAVREGQDLKIDGQVWRRMPLVDGLKLEGRWTYADVKISFTKAGRFEDDGVLAHCGALGTLKYSGAKEFRWPRPPAKGAGTYEIRDFTLFVKYDDGAEWAGDFATLGEEHLLIRMVPIRKER